MTPQPRMETQQSPERGERSPYKPSAKTRLHMARGVFNTEPNTTSPLPDRVNPTTFEAVQAKHTNLRKQDDQRRNALVQEQLQRESQRKDAIKQSLAAKKGVGADQISEAEVVYHASMEGWAGAERKRIEDIRSNAGDQKEIVDKALGKLNLLDANAFYNAATRDGGAFYDFINGGNVYEKLAQELNEQEMNALKPFLKDILGDTLRERTPGAAPDVAFNTLLAVKQTQADLATPAAKEQLKQAAANSTHFPPEDNEVVKFCQEGQRLAHPDTTNAQDNPQNTQQSKAAATEATHNQQPSTVHSSNESRTATPDQQTVSALAEPISLPDGRQLIMSQRTGGMIQTEIRGEKDIRSSENSLEAQLSILRQVADGRATREYPPEVARELLKRLERLQAERNAPLPRPAEEPPSSLGTLDSYHKLPVSRLEQLPNGQVNITNPDGSVNAFEHGKLHVALPSWRTINLFYDTRLNFAEHGTAAYSPEAQGIQVGNAFVDDLRKGTSNSKYRSAEDTLAHEYKHYEWALLDERAQREVMKIFTDPAIIDKTNAFLESLVTDKQYQAYQGRNSGPTLTGTNPKDGKQYSLPLDAVVTEILSYAVTLKTQNNAEAIAKLTNEIARLDSTQGSANNDALQLEKRRLLRYKTALECVEAVRGNDQAYQRLQTLGLLGRDKFNQDYPLIKQTLLELQSSAQGNSGPGAQPSRQTPYYGIAKGFRDIGGEFGGGHDRNIERKVQRIEQLLRESKSYILGNPNYSEDLRGDLVDYYRHVGINYLPSYNTRSPEWIYPSLIHSSPNAPTQRVAEAFKVLSHTFNHVDHAVSQLPATERNLFSGEIRIPISPERLNDILIPRGLKPIHVETKTVNGGQKTLSLSRMLQENELQYLNLVLAQETRNPHWHITALQATGENITITFASKDYSTLQSQAQIPDFSPKADASPTFSRAEFENPPTTEADYRKETERLLAGLKQETGLEFSVDDLLNGRLSRIDPSQERRLWDPPEGRRIYDGPLPTLIRTFVQTQFGTQTVQVIEQNVESMIGTLALGYWHGNGHTIDRLQVIYGLLKNWEYMRKYPDVKEALELFSIAEGKIGGKLSPKISLDDTPTFIFDYSPQRSPGNKVLISMNFSLTTPLPDILNAMQNAQITQDQGMLLLQEGVNLENINAFKNRNKGVK